LISAAVPESSRRVTPTVENPDHGTITFEAVETVFDERVLNKRTKIVYRAVPSRGLPGAHFCGTRQQCIRFLEITAEKARRAAEKYVDPYVGFSYRDVDALDGYRLTRRLRTHGNGKD